MKLVQGRAHFDPRAVISKTFHTGPSDVATCQIR